MPAKSASDIISQCTSSAATQIIATCTTIDTILIRVFEDTCDETAKSPQSMFRGKKDHVGLGGTAATDIAAVDPLHLRFPLLGVQICKNSNSARFAHAGLFQRVVQNGARIVAQFGRAVNQRF